MSPSGYDMATAIMSGHLHKTVRHENVRVGGGSSGNTAGVGE